MGEAKYSSQTPLGPAAGKKSSMYPYPSGRVPAENPVPVPKLPSVVVKNDQLRERTRSSMLCVQVGNG